MDLSFKNIAGFTLYLTFCWSITYIAHISLEEKKICEKLEKCVYHVQIKLEAFENYRQNLFYIYV